LVQYYLPLAEQAYEEDVEYVHQLRVGSRRAQAALDLLVGTLPPKRARRVRRALRQARRAAGPARDLDVMAQRFGRYREHISERVFAELEGGLAHRRRDVQTEFAAALADAATRLASRHIDKLIKKIGWRGAGSQPLWRQFARPSLDAFYNELIRAAERIHTGNEPPTTALHQLRICGKKLRYAMELASGAFGPSAVRGTLYPFVEMLQEKLGAVNDHFSAHAWLIGWSEREKDPAGEAALCELARIESGWLVDARKDFLTWWTGEQLERFRGDWMAIVGEEPAHGQL
jgi:CHAD domain-containing protein